MIVVFVRDKLGAFGRILVVEVAVASGDSKVKAAANEALREGTQRRARLNRYSFVERDRFHVQLFARCHCEIIQTLSF